MPIHTPSLTGQPLIVSIPEAVNKVNAAERSNGVQVYIDFPSNAAINDVIKIEMTGPNNQAVTLTRYLTQADIAAGQCTITIPANRCLYDGVYNLSVTQQNAAGETTVPTLVDFVLDKTAPAAPQAPTSYVDDVGVIQGGASTASVTDDARPGINIAKNLVDTPKLYVDGVLVEATYDPVAGTLTPTQALRDGQHELKVSLTDAAGNESFKSAALSITVDTTAPTAPTAAPTSYKDDIGTVQNAASTATVTDDNKPGLNVPTGLSGTVNLYIDGVKVAATYDSATGTLTPTAAVADGAHTFAYSLSDAAGNESGRSPALNFTVDTTAPNAPAAVVTTDDVGAIQGNIAAGGVTDDTRPTFSGTGTAGDVVKVYDGDTVIGSATVAPDGTWSVTPPAALGEGAHNIATTVTDAAGNESGKSPAVTLNVDTTAPAAPTAAPASYKDDIGTVQNAASTATVTDDNKPGLNVPAGLSGTVNLYVDGVKVASTYDSATGTLTPTAAVADGSHTFAYSLSDAAGNESGRSAAMTFTVDTTAPNAPAAVVATDDVGAIQGNIANNGVTDDTRPTFSGTGTAGDVVKVYDGNTVIGSATVAPDGTWSVTPPSALAEGAHNIATTVTDAAGNESGKSPAVTLNVDTTAPAAPTAAPTSYKDDIGTVQNAASTATVTDDNKPGLNVPTGLSGTVNLYVDGVKVAATYDSATGTLTPTAAVADGSHTFAYSLSDAAGNESGRSAALTFTVDTTAPNAPAAVVATDDVGAIQGTIAAGGVTDDTRPTFSGTGTAGDVVKVYDGNTVIGSATVTSAGTWSVTPATPLGEGIHNIASSATDAAGNESNRGPVLALTVDTTAPATPTTAPTSYKDDIGTVQNAASTATVTDDNKPGLNVPTLLAGTVNLYIDGVKVASTYDSATGTLTPTAAVADGSHTFAYSLSDAAGNESGRSAALTFTVDTTAPNAPAAVVATDDVGAIQGTIAAGGVTDDTRPTFSGTGTAGDVVKVYDGNTVIGSATVTSAGTWSVTPATPLGEGIHNIASSATDAAGNESNRGPVLALTVDTTAPATPTTAPTSYKDDIGTVQNAASTATVTDDNKPGLNVPTLLAGTVNLYIDGVKVAATYDSATGILTPTAAVADGSHTFAYSLSDAAGNESGRSAALTFTVDTTAPNAPAAVVATDDVGAIQGTIAAGGVTDDTRPTFSGTGTAGDVVKVYDGNTVIGSATVTSAGTWSVTPATPLGEGIHNIASSATDAAGNESNRGPVLALTVDTTAPATPTTAPTSYKDDIGTVQNAASTATVTDDNKPGLNVPTLLAGTVNLYIDGVKVAATYDSATGILTPTAAVADGSHTFAYSLSDAAGNESGRSAALTFTVDTTAPNAPAAVVATDDVGAIQGNIVNNSSTDDTKPTFSGTGTAGDLIKVYDGASVIGSATVATGGAWSFTPTVALTQGLHSISVSATDAAGNESARGAARVFTVDTTAPAVPATVVAADDVGAIQGNIANNGVTDDTKPTFSGTGTAGDLIKVYDGTTVIGSATVATGGAWSFTPTTALTQGSHSISVSATDAAGNESARGAALAFTVDTTAPAVPVTVVAADDVGAIQGNIAAGGVTDDTLPTFSGTGTAGDVVKVYDGNAVLGSTTVTSAGTWSFTPAIALSEGAHSISASATDAAGNESARGTALTFTVDTAAPVVPVTVVATDDVGAIQGSIAAGSSTDDTRPAFSGTGTAGDLVKVYDGNTLIGSTTVTSAGTWSMTPATALGEGSHSISASVTDAAGNESGRSTSLTFTVDTTAPAAPTAAPTSYKDDFGTVQNAASTATVTDDNKPGINVPTGLSGTVNLYIDGVKVAATYDGTTGTLTPTAAVADGSHTFAYSQSDAAGNESGRSAALTFTIDTAAPTVPAALVANDDVGAIQGNIADGGATDDTRPTFSGTGTAGDVVKVYDGTTVIGSTTVTSAGTWSFTPATALGEGSHNISVSASDAAGNESGRSTSLAFNVDTTAPATPTTAPTSYKDDIGTVQNAASTATVTDDNKPGLNVPTGLSGTVNLYIDGVKVAATYDSATGTLTPTAAVADGSHTFAYSLSDAAGNESGRSAALTFTVDTTAPAVPVTVVATDDVGAIRGNIANNGVTDDTLPTFSGTGTAGELIKVYDGASVIGSVTVATGGTWSFTPTTALPQGSHSISVSATDAAGNESARGAALVFSVDTTAPAVPATVVAADDVGAIQGNIASNGVTDDTKPTFSGTGTAGDLIKVFDGTTVIGSATVATGGTWSFTPSTDLTQGSHSISVSASDAAGNESARGAALVFTVDTTAPAVPATVVAADDVGAIQGNIANNGVTDDIKPTFSGTGTAGDLIKVFDGTTVIGSATVATGGGWSFTPTVALTQGSHSISVSATDAAGNESARGAALAFTVDTTAPAVPVTVVAADDVGAIRGNIANNGVTDDTKPTFSGTGTAGELIKVYDGASVIGSATVATGGTWSFTPSTDLTQGSHSISVSASDAAGNESARGAALVFTVDTTAPNAPAAVVATDDVGAIQGNIANNGVTDDTKPTFSGTGTAGELIKVFDGTTVIGSATVATGGGWSFTPTVALTQGSHSISVSATDAAGNESARGAALVFSVDTTAPAVPATVVAADDVGAIQGNIANNGVTDDTKPTFSGTGTAGDLIKVYDGTTVIGSATVATGGAWSFTPTTALTQGSHSISISASDAAGNESARGTALTFTVDTTAPAVQATVVATDDVGVFQGNIVNNSSTDDTKPTFSGTGTVGDLIKVYDGASLIGSVTVATGGAWSFTPTTALTAGAHSISVSASDAAGNESGRSNALAFTVDTTATSNTTAGVAVSLRTDADNNGWVNASEVGTANTLTTRASFNASAVAGDWIEFTATNNGVALAAQRVQLTAANITNGWVDVAFAKPAEGTVQSVSARYLDAAGNYAADTAPADSARLDTVALAPVITTVKTNWYNGGYNAIYDVPNGGTMQPGFPFVYGTAEAGSAVDVYLIADGGTPTLVGTVTADSTGNFAYNYYNYNGRLLRNTTNTFRVMYRDQAGNNSIFSNDWTLNMDSVAPSVPAVNATDDVGVFQGAITNNSFTDDTKPTFSGTGTAGDVIKVYDGNTVIGSVTVAAGGTWSFTPTTALAEGLHNITATATDPARNESAKSTVLAFTVDTTSTSNATVGMGVSLSSDANNDGWVNASEQGSASNFTSRATFNANAVAGDKVVFTAYYNGVALANQTVTLTATDIANKYVNASFTKPAEGATLTVTANYMDAAGNSAADSIPADSAKLDTIAPGAPSVHGVILSSQYSAADVPMYVELPSNAAVGDKVTVTMTNTVISTGARSVAYTTTLTVTAQDLAAGQIGYSVPGSYFSKAATTEFTASMVDVAGNVSVLGYAAPAAPSVEVALVDSDFDAFYTNDGQIMPDATRAENTDVADLYDYATIDKTLEFQGNANANDTVYLYENGVQIGVASNLGVSDQGIQAWGFSGTFAVGDHAITAKSVNAAGVVSDQSVVFTFSIQKELDIPDLSLLTGSSYSVANATPERLTLQAQDVLDLDRTLTVLGDVSDTLVVDGAQQVSAYFSEAQLGIDNEYVQHIPGTNGQSGFWQFDLDGSGTMDLMVSDTVHRIILSA